MNTYSKFVPNVFLAKCTERHEKGDVIEMSTKYGKTHNCIVFNLIYERDNFFYYSIVREDGFDSRAWAQRKAEKYSGYADSAERKSNDFYKSSHAATEHIPLGQPILVGHHSESAHRRALDKSWNDMGKCVAMSEKAEAYESRANYWANKANTINLSMPESLEFYEYEIERTKAIHEGMKNGTIERAHSYSLTYAKKELNEAESKLGLAKKLWA